MREPKKGEKWKHCETETFCVIVCTCRYRVRAGVYKDVVVYDRGLAEFVRDLDEFLESFEPCDEAT